MQPLMYRWDRYCQQKQPTPWRAYTPGKIARALRAWRPGEVLRVMMDNGQEVIVRPRQIGVA